ncbi:mesenteric estrogen-dependent adipogenesis protein-like isoform X3 [Carcharodon carcharias]|uniref:mesenteric estrogen-dependent adipogenesis protein-like isoform X3 n=1 Tax=Carcharodon carcharias TaxID=13397 RepID=UPI001B7E4B7E|nr:mesenteric estrogen-dependent adipogenesis protein-like isoform X3 [Carcharodon carcharias]
MSTDCPDSSVTDPHTPLPPVCPSATNCEIALLPLELLLSLQRSQFPVVGNSIQISKEPGAGYNVISNGQVNVDGQQCNLVNSIQRKITLTSHKEYRNFQETILSKPMVLFTNVKLTEGSKNEMVYAIIVNTRHPRMRQEIEDSMKDVTASEMETNYVLQTKELNGKILDLSCITEDEKCKVKNLLDKMSEPNVRMDSVSEQSSGAVSSLCAGSSEKEVFSSSRAQPYAKRTPIKETSSTQLPVVNEKSYLLQFTQNLPKYIE